MTAQQKEKTMFTIYKNEKEIRTTATGGEAHAYCKSECMKEAGYAEYVVKDKNGFNFAIFDADDIKLTAERV